MAYAVDFVLNVMKKLSTSEPYLFQRDGSLYVASAEGFGQITYGLDTEPEKIQPWEKRKQNPEITESIDAIKEWVGDWNKKPKFIKGEEKYLQAIAFGPNSDSFTLEDITKAAQQLRDLLDDEKIRMVLHGSCYHSHKYGYAADGTDVWVQQARVMDKGRYLELLRGKEDEILQNIESVVGQLTERRDIQTAYNRLTFPDCVIMTPYMIISLPRDGKLHLHRDEPDSWTQNTRLESNYSGSTKGSILRHFDVNTYKESQFKVSVMLNAQNLKTPDTGDKVLERISKELNAVNSNMATAEEFIARINAIHNIVVAPNIEWNKKLVGKRN